jgi:hypothetical protein
VHQLQARRILHDRLEQHTSKERLAGKANSRRPSLLQSLASVSKDSGAIVGRSSTGNLIGGLCSLQLRILKALMAKSQ